MSIFNYSHYKSYLKDYIAALPKNGRGEIGKMAAAIDMHPTLMSMVISADRDFTYEQAFSLAEYLELTDLESEYLLLLIQHERAGTQKLKKHFKAKLEKIKSDSNKIANRFEHETKLNDQERSIFYSSWIFSAIRLFCSTSDDGKSLQEISERFMLPRQRIVEAIGFMLKSGLIVEHANNYKMGISRTYLENNSPHLPRHHMNWRAKAIQKSDHVQEDELMFTFPMSISRKDFSKVRETLAEALKEISRVVKDSPAEEVGCLNIDLFWIES